MKSANNPNSLALNNYGASELKVYSANAAFKGFAFTLFIIISVILIGILIKKEVENITEPEIFIPSVTSINIKEKLPDIVQPVGNPLTQTEIFDGTKKVSGDFKAVDDNKAKITSDDIAAGPDIAISAPTLGKGDNIIQTLPPVNANTTTIKEPEQKIELPKEGEYQYADVEPAVDLNKLQSSILYPALAKKIGVEGKVYLSILIAKDGRVLEAKIDESDNMLLNESALNAVKTPGIFSPAIRNHQPIDYWVLIPINFRLK